MAISLVSVGFLLFVSSASAALEGTTTTLECNPGTLLTLQNGEAASCTATVVNNDQSGQSEPTGFVDFVSSGPGTFGGTDPSCMLEVLGRTTGACTISYTPTAVGPGTHKITATYRGTGSHETSHASDSLVVVRPTTTTLTCDPSPVALRAASTCTATVSDSAQTPTVSTGEVRFTTDGTGKFSAGGACTLSGSPGPGKTSCSITYTPTAVGTGSHTVTAAYVGDKTHFDSRGASPIVVLHPTATTLSCAPPSVNIGSASACTVTVKDTSAGPTQPSGEVKLASDGPGAFSNGSHCILAPAGQGKASCQINYTPSAVGSGSHRITASFQGDPGHQGSTGSGQVQVIARSQPPNTRLTKKPRQKAAGGLAKFRFASDQAGSTFQCKLDKRPFRPCHSPFKARLKPGRHTFSVRAVNAAGVADPTPAVLRWKVQAA